MTFRSNKRHGHRRNNSFSNDRGRNKGNVTQDKFTAKQIEKAKRKVQELKEKVAELEGSVGKGGKNTPKMWLITFNFLELEFQKSIIFSQVRKKIKKINIMQFFFTLYQFFNIFSENKISGSNI